LIPPELFFAGQKSERRRPAPFGALGASQCTVGMQRYEPNLKVLEGMLTGCGRSGRSHPADNQASGTKNSDHPQSRQTRISGEGLIGGWLNVRGTLR
jgi:hypothetical protein